MKKVFGTLGLILLLAVGAAWYFITVRLDTVIESRLERAATTSLGSHVEVGGVETNLREGSLTVREITVANPPGFENPFAMRFKQVEAAVNYDGLEVKRVSIDSPEFHIEEQGGVTNMELLLQAIESAPVVEAPTESSVAEPEIVIQHFRVDSTRASFESRSLDRFTEVKVDAVELYDLRGTPSELSRVIARAMLKELSRAAGLELLKASARKKTGELGEKISGSLNSIFGGSDGEEDGEPEGEPDGGQ